MTRTQGSRGAAYFISIAFLLLAIAAPLLIRDEKTGTEDFGHFYRAADAMRHGQDIYAAAKGHYIYPPLLAFVLQPLTLFPENQAIFVWLGLSSLAVLGAAAIAAKETYRRWIAAEGNVAPYLPWAIAAAATILTADKLHKMFGLGQSDAFVLLGFAGVLRLMNRRPWLAGMIVGAVANVKYLSVIFVPYFLVKRNYRAALSAVASFVFFLALPALQVGFARGVGYALAAFGGLGHMMGLAEKQPLKILGVTWNRSVSITSALFRVTRGAGISDLAALLILLVVFAAIVAGLIVAARRQGVLLFRASESSPVKVRARIETLEWAALIFFAVAFSPQTTARHMVLTLLIYSVAIPVFLVQRERISKILLAGSVVLMAASLSLPPSGSILNVWRGASGASWCAMILTIAIVWSGSRAIAASDDHRNAPAA